LRSLSGGKPIGFKLCLGQPQEFAALCHAMIETGVVPDFITVDGGEVRYKLSILFWGFI